MDGLIKITAYFLVRLKKENEKNENFFRVFWLEEILIWMSANEEEI